MVCYSGWRAGSDEAIASRADGWSEGSLEQTVRPDQPFAERIGSLMSMSSLTM